MSTFLFWIGWYNLLGAPVLMAMHNERVADSVLRRYTEIIMIPYGHGSFGRLWLWWAAAAQLFIGGIMVRATIWPAAIQRDVVVATIVVYVVMYGVLAIGARRPKYGRCAIMTQGALQAPGSTAARPGRSA